MPNKNSQDQFDRLATEISKAYWCSFDNSLARHSPAIISLEDEHPHEISWFDMLFGGHILIPKVDEKKETKPITFLIMGDPGSGKTTLALELCYRLAMVHSFKTLYISMDTESDRLIQKANDFGWKNSQNTFVKYSPNLDKEDIPGVIVWGKDKIKNWNNLADIVETALHTLGIILSPYIRFTDQPINYLVHKMRDVMRPLSNAKKFQNDILVIDSLNIIEPEKREKFFEQFLNITYKGTRIVIFILDGGSTGQAPNYWEYVCDNVIRLGSSYEYDYFLRTIEVVKTRFQYHTLGKQQLKIYGKPEEDCETDEIEHNIRARRAHPTCQAASSHNDLRPGARVHLHK
jgi:KaiC/GvpD/RAD55 family RecA-like ATPase